MYSNPDQVIQNPNQEQVKIFVQGSKQSAIKRKQVTKQEQQRERIKELKARNR